MTTIEQALRELEVCANTVDGCYTRNPGNFAAALRDLRDSAERARTALAALESAQGGEREAPEPCCQDWGACRKACAPRADYWSDRCLQLVRSNAEHSLGVFEARFTQQGD